MSDNIVRDGLIGGMSQMLSRKLGRRVVVHRVETMYRRPGQSKLSKNIRYSLGIEGSHPPVFFGMTVEEVKSRMAFLSDLLSSGVIYASPQNSAAAASTGPLQGVLRGASAEGPDHQAEGDGDRAGGLVVPPGGDDCDERPY